MWNGEGDSREAAAQREDRSRVGRIPGIRPEVVRPLYKEGEKEEKVRYLPLLSSSKGVLKSSTYKD